VRFKVDEDLPREVAVLLRSVGHEAETVHDEGMSGFADEDIGKKCQDESRALVTLDVGFANVQTYPPEEYRGLIVMRLRRQDKPSVLSALRAALPLLDSESLDRALWIVEEGRVRIRRRS